MKRTLLFFTVLLQASFLMAQGSLELFDHEDNEFFNGQNYTVPVDFDAWETVSPELFVKNISANDISIKIRVEEIFAPAGTTNNFCGLGSCYAPNTMETPNPFLVAAGQLIGPEGVFSSHYQANNIPGDARVRYTFFNIDDLNDTISVTFTFDDVATGINDDLNPTLVDVYPNPASNYVQVNLQELNLNNGRVEIYNALGTLCFEQKFTGESELSLNLSQLPKGVYLYRVESQGVYTSTSKLILR